MSISKQLEEATTEGQYEVRWTVYVDRPEKRDASYRPVKAGTAVPHSKMFDNRNKAMSFAKGLIAGEDDSESDFVKNVSVTSPNQGGGYKWVMKTVERERGADGKVTSRKTT